MNIQIIATSKFNMPAGTKIVRYSDDPMFGPRFGEVSTSYGDEVSGMKLLTAIQVGARMVADIQAAIDDMQAVLDAGPIAEVSDTKSTYSELVDALREIEALDDSVVGLDRIEYARNISRALLSRIPGGAA